PNPLQPREREKGFRQWKVGEFEGDEDLLGGDGDFEEAFGGVASDGTAFVAASAVEGDLAGDFFAVAGAAAAVGLVFVAFSVEQADGRVVHHGIELLLVHAV